MITLLNMDIFSVKAAAIVNPANVSLLRGSGLCGHIHKQAGRELENYCKNLGVHGIGDVALTPSFNLKQFNFIIHACGPRWIDGKRNEEESLIKVYKNIFQKCIEKEINSVAIPAISTGIYLYPVFDATNIALNEAIKYRDSGIKIIFVNPEKEKHEIYKNWLSKIKIK